MRAHPQHQIYQVVAESVRVLAKGDEWDDDGGAGDDAPETAGPSVLNDTTVYLEDFDSQDPFALPSPSKKVKNG